MTIQSDFGRRGFSWSLVAAVGLMCIATAAWQIGAAQAPEADRWIEFDVTERDYSITGFIVGYFVPGKSEPAFVFRVKRTRATAPRRGIVKLPLIQGALPAGETFVMRIQTVAGLAQSEWSEPSPPFTVSAAEAQSGAKLTPEEPSRRPSTPSSSAQSAAADLDRHPAATDRLSALFRGRNLSKDAAGFRTVLDLLAAEYAASNLKIPFEEIKRLTADAANQDLQKAIAQLRPDVDAAAEAKRAVRQSRQALEDAVKRAP